MQLIRQVYRDAFQTKLRDLLQLKAKWNEPNKPIKLKKNDIVMAPPSLNERRRYLYLPAYVQRVHEAPDGQQRTVDVYIPGLRTRSGRTSRRQLQTFDVRHLAPLEVANKSTKVMFRPEVKYYTEHIDDYGTPTFTMETKVMNFNTRQETAAQEQQVMWDHWSQTLDEQVFNDNMDFSTKDLPLPTDGLHPLQQPTDDDEAGDLHLPPEPADLRTRAGRRIRAPSYLKDFEL